MAGEAADTSPGAAAPEDGKRPAGKSPDAFRTISEVADELDLPQHVLRFWETRFPQVKPLKRGGSRRYYRPQDVDILRHIRHLLYDQGYTIKGVQRLLKEAGAKAAFREAARADGAGTPVGSQTASEFEGAKPAAGNGSGSVSSAQAGKQETAGAVPSSLTPRQRAEIMGVLDELRSLRAMLQSSR